jgi:hypothetical protein
LKLANFDLQRALLANRETPQTIVEAEIERLRRSVAAAEKRFARAKAAWKSASSSAAIETAEQQHNQAESAYRKALTANRVTPNAVNPLELQRLELAAELARYDVCKQRAENDVRSVLGELEWEVSTLREEVTELRRRVGELSR